MCCNDYVVRIHLKTDCQNRDELIKFCLGNPKEQYLAIGWSFLAEGTHSYTEYLRAVSEYQKSYGHRMNPAHHIFNAARENDLFWTRDMNGYYWICRAKVGAQSFCDKEKDIGAVIPVEAYLYGLEVPGQIKASFNRPRGGTAERIYDRTILEFSRYAFNAVSKTEKYQVEPINGNLLDNLPEFELEELVIDYIQLKYNYYLLSNSIANKSTTIAVECEFRSRDFLHPGRAVVQVKGGKDIALVASTYKDFLAHGYRVFLYAPHYVKDYNGDIVYISREDLMEFYQNYKGILPDSITKWENLFCDIST